MKTPSPFAGQPHNTDHRFSGLLSRLRDTLSLTAKQHRRRNRLRTPTVESLEGRLLLVATLDLQLDQVSVNEATGEDAITATLTRLDPPTLATQLNVILSINDAQELSFPDMVTIPANAASTTFSIHTINDAIVDGTVNATITATAVGFGAGTVAMEITDDDTAISKTIGGELDGSLPADTYGVSHTISVLAGKQLTVSPGAAIEFSAGQAVEVFGQLLAQGTAAEPITFNSAANMPSPGDWEGLFFLGDTTQPQTLLEHVVIEHAETGVNMTGRGLPVTIDSADIGHNQVSGIYATVAGSSLHTVTNTHIHDNGSYGIFTRASGPAGCSSSATGLTVTNNEIDLNGQSGFHMTASGSGCFPFGSSTGVANSIITGNYIHDNLNGITGSVGSRGSVRPVIQNNFVFDNLLDGIRFDASSGTRIAPLIVNNTIVRNGGDGIYHTQFIGSGLQIFNNLISGNVRGIATAAGYTVPDGTLGSNNVFDNSGGNWTNFPVSVGAATTTNHNGTASDSRLNISVNPGFAADDLHLATDSTLVGAGTDSSGVAVPATDIDGDNRETPPDIGADEVPKLTLSFSPIGSLVQTSSGVSGFYQIREDTPAATVTGTVRRTVADLSSPLTVSVANPDSSALTLPTSVTIPAGSATTEFSVDTVDDGNIETDSDLVISLSAPATAGTAATIRIVDDELLPAAPVSDPEHRINLVETTNVQTDADVAWLSDTLYVAVWKSNSTTQSHTIRARVFDISNQPVGEEILLASVPGGSGEQRPQVGVDASGNFVVAWSWIESGSTVTRRVMSRRFAADGTPLTDEITLATDTGVSPGLNSLAVAADGRWSIQYRDYAISTPTVFVQRLSPAGNPEGNVESNPFTASADHSSIVYDTSGNLIAVGLSSVGILGRIHTASTNTWSEVFVVSPDPGGSVGYFSPTVYAADDGTFVVSWLQRDFPTITVLAKRMNADGSPSTEDLEVASGTTISLGRSPSVASSSSGNFGVTWSLSSGEIMMRQYHRDGLPMNDAVQLNTASGTHAVSRIALAPNEDRIVAIWEGDGPGDSYGIFGRQLEFPKPTLQLQFDSTTIFEGAASATGTLTRFGINTAGPLTTTLIASHPTQIDAPITLVIPAGQNSATFTVTAVDDSMPEVALPITFSVTAAGFSTAASTINVFDNDAPLALSIDMPVVSENAGVAGTSITVLRNTDTSSELTVGLTSSDTTEATVPSTVIIPAGESSVTVPVSVIDDAEVDGTQTVIFTATAAAHPDAIVTLDVTNDDLPPLTVSPAAPVIDESAGASATSVTISRDGDTSVPLVVTLSSSDPSELTIPQTAIIAVNQSSVTVPVSAIDDELVDGLQSVTITASVAGRPDGIATVDVTDNDTATITLLAATSLIAENAGVAATTITVIRNTNPTDSLVVELFSDDITAATVPHSVTIDAGQTSATVAVAAVDDLVVDGTQNVTITAAAAGHADGNASLEILDNETAELTVVTASTISEGAGSPATVVTISRNTDVSFDLPITLAVNDLTEASVPVSAVIPAGQTSVSAPLSAVEDSIVDGTQTITITAAADGHADGVWMLDVTDNDVPELSVSIAAMAVSETAGTSATTLTITRNTDTTNELTVTLSSSDTTEATVPATATIAAGDASVTVPVAAIDDGVIDGTQIVTITATAVAHAHASGTVEVIQPTAPLDIDGNGVLDAATDGILVIRYLFGFRGNALTQGAIAGNAGAATSAEVEASLLANAGMLDADGNGVQDAATDGILTIRYLFGFRGTALSAGAIGAGAVRTDGAQVAAFLDGFVQPPSPAAVFQVLPQSSSNTVFTTNAAEEPIATSDLLTANASVHIYPTDDNQTDWLEVLQTGEGMDGPGNTPQVFIHVESIPDDTADELIAKNDIRKSLVIHKEFPQAERPSASALETQAIRSRANEESRQLTRKAGPEVLDIAMADPKSVQEILDQTGIVGAPNAIDSLPIGTNPW